MVATAMTFSAWFGTGSCGQWPTPANRSRLVQPRQQKMNLVCSLRRYAPCKSHTGPCYTFHVTPRPRCLPTRLLLCLLLHMSRTGSSVAQAQPQSGLRALEAAQEARRSRGGKALVRLIPCMRFCEAVMGSEMLCNNYNTLIAHSYV